jgi:hypothetical protein
MLAMLGGFAANSFPATNVPLNNAGLEAPYTAVGGNATITGQIAQSWNDNSYWQDPSPLIAYSQETSNPHSGSSCQKVVITSIGADRFQMVQGFAAQGGSIYTLSAWVRGTPGVQVTLSLQQAVQPYATLLSSSIALSDTWQQVTAIGYVVTGQDVLFMLGSSTPGTVWIDDAAASYAAGSPNPAPNIGPVSPSFFGMHVANYQRRLLRNGGLEPPYTGVGLSNGISGEVALNWSDNSSWANPLVTYSMDIVKPHSGGASQKIAVASTGTGGAVQFAQQVTVLPEQAYTLTAWVRGDPGMTIHFLLREAGGTYASYSPGGYPSFTLTSAWQKISVTGFVHNADGTPAGDVYLMFHTNSTGTFYVDDVTFTDAAGKPVQAGVPWPQAPFGQLRLWDSGTSWTELEPQKGVWNWAPLDDWVTAAGIRGRTPKQILLTLGQSPQWASSQPDNVNYIGAGAPAPPKDLRDWRNYIRAVGQRYKGRIRNYEIWNEPNDRTYYAGTVPQLVELTREAYQILKQIDPQNVIVAPVPYETGYLDQLLQAGMAPWVDVIAFHVYTYTAAPETVGQSLASVRLVMAKNGVSNKPLWDTEGASGITSTPEDQGAAYLVRRYLVDLAYGSGRYNWYTWGKGSSFCAATEKDDPRSLTKAGVAFGILQGWLLGASITQATIGGDNTWQIGLTLSNGTSALIVWNPVSSVPFQIPANVQAVTASDIFGGLTAITSSTVIVNDSPLLLSSNSH